MEVFIRGRGEVMAWCNTCTPHSFITESLWFGHKPQCKGLIQTKKKNTFEKDGILMLCKNPFLPGQIVSRWLRIREHFDGSL